MPRAPLLHTSLIGALTVTASSCIRDLHPDPEPRGGYGWVATTFADDELRRIVPLRISPEGSTLSSELGYLAITFGDLTVLVDSLQGFRYGRDNKFDGYVQVPGIDMIQRTASGNLVVNNLDDIVVISLEVDVVPTVVDRRPGTYAYSFPAPETPTDQPCGFSSDAGVYRTCPDVISDTFVGWRPGFLESHEICLTQ